MDKITYFLICDTTNNAPMPGGMGLNVVNPQLLLMPTYVPGNFSFAIVIGVQDIDTSSPARVKFELLSPGNKLIYKSLEMDLPGVDMNNVPSKYKGILMSFELRNVPIDEEGAYVLKLFINDQEVGQREIPIFKRGK